MVAPAASCDSPVFRSIASRRFQTNHIERDDPEKSHSRRCARRRTAPHQDARLPPSRAARASLHTRWLIYRAKYAVRGARSGPALRNVADPISDMNGSAAVLCRAAPAGWASFIASYYHRLLIETASPHFAAQRRAMAAALRKVPKKSTATARRRADGSTIRRTAAEAAQHVVLDLWTHWGRLEKRALAGVALWCPRSET